MERCQPCREVKPLRPPASISAGMDMGAAAAADAGAEAGVAFVSASAILWGSCGALCARWKKKKADVEAFSSLEK